MEVIHNRLDLLWLRNANFTKVFPKLHNHLSPIRTIWTPARQGTEISELVLTHPLLQHEESLLLRTASHELWVAPSAAQRKTILGKLVANRAAQDWMDNHNNSNAVVAGPGALPLGSGLPYGIQRHVTLEGINACIAETRTIHRSHTARGQEVSTQCECQPLQFFDQHLPCERRHYCQRPVLHGGHMALSVHFTFNRL